MIQDQKNFLILPPLTSGKLHGYLTMSVDEILWNQNFPGNVSVECQWWGDQQMIKFRPSNILQATSTKNTDTKKIFHIKTTPSLFEKYLINCDTLKLLVINDDKKETIGYVYVKGLHKIATELQYQSYFPILDSYRNRIGDLHIVFSLYLKKENEESITNSFKTVEKDPVVRVKMKKGCDTCFKDRKLYKPKESNNNPKLTIPEITVPPNTQRTEYSDVIVSEILSKGQQLRNAMVMSVLEDCNIMDSGSSINVSNFNLFPHHDSQNKPSSKTIDLPKSPVKYHEKIVDFLLGKDMTEEEELKTLETFRSTSPSHSLIELLEIQNKVDAELEEPLKNDQPITCRSNLTYEDQQCIRNETIEAIHILPPVFNKLNCFRLTIKNLILTDLGQKKIKPSEKKRNLTKSKEVKIQPVTTYFIECHKDQDVINQNYPWKSKTERFCSRRQIDNIVFFGQSTVHTVNTPFNLATLRSTLNRLTWLVFWKHFNQRSTSLLGKINFDSILLVRDLETVRTLPVETVDGVSGNVEILLELGENKKTFGNIVLEKSAKISSHNINMKKTDKEEDMFINTKHTCIDIIKEKNNYDLSESNYSENIALNIHDTEDNSHCIKCRALLEKCEIKSQMRPIVCTQCQTYFNLFPKSVHYSLQNQSFCTSQPPSLMTHEITLRIENINNFPLFLINNEDIRCYVDYKFFKIDESGKVGVSQETYTSKVLFCENTVNFDSYQTYELNMPLKMLLASCLVSYKPGITFQIWQRYFKPSPRDHMVAMAYLPTIKLAIMESKFNELSTKQPILEKIKLPLVLVPSSVTTPYQNHSNFGTLEISISYRNYLFFEPNEIENLNSNQETMSWEKLCVQENTEVKSTDNLSNVLKNYGKTILKNKEKENKLTQTEIEDEVKFKKNNNYEENFKFMRRCFWTGEAKNIRYQLQTFSKINETFPPAIDDCYEVDSKLGDQNSDIYSKRDTIPIDFLKQQNYFSSEALQRMDMTCPNSNLSFVSDYYNPTSHTAFTDFEVIEDEIKPTSPTSEMSCKQSSILGKEKDLLDLDPMKRNHQNDFPMPLLPPDGEIVLSEEKSFYYLVENDESKESLVSNANVIQHNDENANKEKPNKNKISTVPNFKTQRDEIIDFKVCNTQNVDEKSEKEPAYENSKNEILSTSEKTNTNLNLPEFVVQSCDKSSMKNIKVDISSKNKSDEQSCDENSIKNIDLENKEIDVLINKSIPIMRVNSKYPHISENVELNTSYEQNEQKNQIPKTSETHIENIISDSITTETDNSNSIYNGNSNENVMWFGTEFHSCKNSKQRRENFCTTFCNENLVQNDNIKSCSNFNQKQNGIQNINTCPDSCSELNYEDRLFKAKVEIQQALNLPKVFKVENDKAVSVPPNTFVTFKCGSFRNPCEIKTKVVKESCEPTWMESWEVELDYELLEKVDKRMVFDIFYTNQRGNYVSGFATADLNLLSIGLPRLRCWLNITDLAFTCKGQLKINIEPLEDVSCAKVKLATDLSAFNKLQANGNKDFLLPSFIASSTEIHISNGDLTNSKIEIEETITKGVKRGKHAEILNDISQLETANQVPSFENIQTREHVHAIKRFCVEKDTSFERSQVDKIIEVESEEKTNSTPNDITDNIAQVLENFTDPLALQSIIAKLSEIQMNQLKINSLKHTSIQTFNKSTFCDLNNDKGPLKNLNEDQNILEEQLIQYDTSESDLGDVSSTYTRFSDISTDKSDEIVDVSEGRNHTGEVKLHGKLQRQDTFILET